MRRKRLRLVGYDYSQGGNYFVTIDIQDRLRLLADKMAGVDRADTSVRPYPYRPYGICPKGGIRVGEIMGAGGIVGADRRVCPNDENRAEIPNGEIRANMPIRGDDGIRADTSVRPYKENESGKMVGYWWRQIGIHFKGVELDEWVVMPDHFHGIIRIIGEAYGLGDIIQWFKTMTTNEYIRGVKSKGWPEFKGRLWQRSYFERIIRGSKALAQVRQYIRNNPSKWSWQ